MSTFCGTPSGTARSPSARRKTAYEAHERPCTRKACAHATPARSDENSLRYHRLAHIRASPTWTACPTSSAVLIPAQTRTSSCTSSVYLLTKLQGSASTYDRCTLDSEWMPCPPLADGNTHPAPAASPTAAKRCTSFNVPASDVCGHAIPVRALHKQARNWQLKCAQFPHMCEDICPPRPAPFPQRRAPPHIVSHAQTLRARRVSRQSEHVQKVRISCIFMRFHGHPGEIARRAPAPGRTAARLCGSFSLHDALVLTKFWRDASSSQNRPLPIILWASRGHRVPVMSRARYRREITWAVSSQRTVCAREVTAR